MVTSRRKPSFISTRVAARYLGISHQQFMLMARTAGVEHKPQPTGKLGVVRDATQSPSATTGDLYVFRDGTRYVVRRSKIEEMKRAQP